MSFVKKTNIKVGNITFRGTKVQRKFKKDKNKS